MIEFTCKIWIFTSNTAYVMLNIHKYNILYYIDNGTQRLFYVEATPYQDAISCCLGASKVNT